MRCLLLATAMLVMPAMASACPMCKAGNDKAGAMTQAEQVEAQSRATAYMYSIFFMMSMPPLVLAGLTLAIRREVRKAAAEQSGTLT